MRYVIANWKMNLPNTDIAEYVGLLEQQNTKNLRVMIAPPSPYLVPLKQYAKDCIIASQNISLNQEESGAYTGQISAKFLKHHIGIDFAIIGHSERRKYNNESNSDVKQKLINAVNAKITPIICIGEDRSSRDSGTWDKYLRNQIYECLPLDDQDIMENNIIIAYEPIWAIGTGLSAPADEIEKTISYIYKTVSGLAKNVKIIYGGSVNSKNAGFVRDTEYLSGFLVGKASLDAEEFKKIIKNYA
ncbi:MAG: triose-phosphate isomerase [Rickettsiaceae bacterium]|nr:triose-phosphate isomerase [Rickettsiaceae bacterium]